MMDDDLFVKSHGVLNREKLSKRFTCRLWLVVVSLFTCRLEIDPLEYTLDSPLVHSSAVVGELTRLGI